MSISRDHAARSRKARKGSQVQRHGRVMGRQRRQQIAQVEQLESIVLLSFVQPVIVVNNGTSPVGLTPPTIEQAYGFNQSPVSSDDGTGTTIAIIDFGNDPTIASDAQAFNTQFGLKQFGAPGGSNPTLTVVNENGQTTSLPTTGTAQSLDETSLDVEWAHAIAPGANILLIETPATPSVADVLTSVDTARNWTGVVAVSMSFTTSESSTDPGNNSHFITPGGHLGVEFVAATGDTGGGAQWPSSSPNVLAVGGTTLTVDSNGNWVSEDHWTSSDIPGNPSDNVPGSGNGGASAYQSEPTAQTSVQSSSFREVPDVSYNAGNGVAVYNSNDSSGPWIGLGGTSAGAPQWAGLIARTDEGLLGGSRPTLQGIAPFYAVPSTDYHSIVGATGPYNTQTGLGSPIANKIFADLFNSTLPVVDPSTDTGVSNHDGITKDNGSSSAPLTFDVNGVSPANGYVWLYNMSNPNNPVLLAGPVQAVNGLATVTLNGQTNTPFTDGTYKIADTISSNIYSQSAFSSSWPVTIWTSLQVDSTSPANGAFVSSLPNGQITITFSHPLAGLTSGGPAISATDPFGVFVEPQGPDGAFDAVGLNSGSAPIHIDTLYTVNPDGTSTITITPTSKMSSDFFRVSVVSGDYQDLAGNSPPTTGNSAYNVEFLYQPVTNSNDPYVTSFTTLGGQTVTSTPLAQQPDAFSITFSKPLDLYSVNPSTVFLGYNANGNYYPVSSYAAYSPTTNSIIVTPTAPLYPGKAYVITIAGAPSANPNPKSTNYVSDDQGFGLTPGNPLVGSVYLTFSVATSGVGAGSSPLTVTQTYPAGGSYLTQAPGYYTVTFSEPINFSALGAYNVMLASEKGGLNDSAFDVGDTMVNERIAFNPNTNQIIIVPTQPILPVSGSDLYLIALSQITSPSGDQLQNNANPVGPAGYGSNPPWYMVPFEVNPGGSHPNVILGGGSLKGGGGSSGSGGPPATALSASEPGGSSTSVASDLGSVSGGSTNFGATSGSQIPVFSPPAQGPIVSAVDQALADLKNLAFDSQGERRRNRSALIISSLLND